MQDENGQELHRCGHCHEHKPASEFHRRSMPYGAVNHNGLQNWCRVCQLAQSRAQWEAKKEAGRAARQRQRQTRVAHVV
jgi:hypothetical protein